MNKSILSIVILSALMLQTGLSVPAREIKIIQRQNESVQVGNRRHISFQLSVPAEYNTKKFYVAFYMPEGGAYNVSQDGFEERMLPLMIIPQMDSQWKKKTDFLSEIFQTHVVLDNMTDTVNTLLWYSAGRKETEDTVIAFSSRVRRPFRMLEYPLDDYNLDFNSNKSRPRKELKRFTAETTLRCAPGSHMPDEKDSLTSRSLEELKSSLSGIINSESKKLMEIHIEGWASPAGNSAANEILAGKRLSEAVGIISSVVPEYIRERTFIMQSAKVAAWDDVATAMEKDSLFAEAAELRAILDGASSEESRYSQIRNLPFYEDDIVPYLSEFRKITIECRYADNSFPSPEEIYARYMEDNDYHSGAKEFSSDQFWHLFKMVEDRDELYELYRRACDQYLKEYGRPWMLSSYLLAKAKAQRGISDTALLAPFINKYVPETFIMRNEAGIRVAEINNPAVIAMQAVMYTIAGDLSGAERLLRVLPDNECHSLLKSMIMYQADYFAASENESLRAVQQERFNDILSSSPRNKAIMYLSLCTDSDDARALEIVESLPEDDAMTYYLKAVLACRRAAGYSSLGDNNNSFKEEEDAAGLLSEAIRRDCSLKKTAEYDGDISEAVWRTALQSL